MKESALQRKVRKQIKAAFPYSETWKNHGSALSKVGLEDISCVINCHFIGRLLDGYNYDDTFSVYFAIETKLTNNKLSKRQIKRCNDLAKIGCRYIQANEDTNIVELINKWLSEQNLEAIS